MDEEEPLTFDDPWLDSNTTTGGCSPVRSTPQELGSPRETAVKVHAWESEVEVVLTSVNFYFYKKYSGCNIM